MPDRGTALVESFQFASIQLAEIRTSLMDRASELVRRGCQIRRDRNLYFPLEHAIRFFAAATPFVYALTLFVALMVILLCTA